MSPIDEVDLTQLPGWDSLPADLRQVFVDAHLPSSFFAYDEENAGFAFKPDLRWIEFPPYGRFLQFGTDFDTTSCSNKFCMDPTTGQIVMLTDAVPPIFVNSTLALLGDTFLLNLKYERQFTTGNDEQCWAAGNDFIDEVEQIDPPAADPDNYWGSFASDVQAGNYSDREDFNTSD